jgi:hypothetical protein
VLFEQLGAGGDQGEGDGVGVGVAMVISSRAASVEGACDYLVRTLAKDARALLKLGT